KERAIWERLTPTGLSDLFARVAPVVEVPDKDEMAKRFDLMMLRLQLAVAEQAPEEDRLFNQLYSVADQLARMANIPAIQARFPAIQAVLAVGNNAQLRRATFGL